jgi:hypothetical protein
MQLGGPDQRLRRSLSARCVGATVSAGVVVEAPLSGAVSAAGFSASADFSSLAFVSAALDLI